MSNCCVTGGYVLDCFLAGHCWLLVGNSPRFSSCVPGSVRRRERVRHSPAEPGWGSPWFRSPHTPAWTCPSTGSPTYSNIHSVTGGHRVKRHLRHSHPALRLQGTGYRAQKKPTPKSREEAERTVQLWYLIWLTEKPQMHLSQPPMQQSSSYRNVSMIWACFLEIGCLQSLLIIATNGNRTGYLGKHTQLKLKGLLGIHRKLMSQ